MLTVPKNLQIILHNCKIACLLPCDLPSKISMLLDTYYRKLAQSNKLQFVRM